MQIKCPRCRELTTWEENPYRPFCSVRCSRADLGSWAAEEYAIPVQNEENEDEAETGENSQDSPA
jgi:endogenous inhibitor of DNA gyrase (YacG/DUF329 family)